MLTVVTGPPCSGKSTYARQSHKPGDILIDFDLIAQALGSPAPHDHPDHVRWVARAARRAAIEAAIVQHHRGATVWIVQTTIGRSDAQRYASANAEIVTLTAEPDVLHARAEAERPAKWHELIDAWTPTQTRPDWQRGRTGRPWRRTRALILATSRVCWWCGHDGATDVDHVQPLAKGGDPLNTANLKPIHGNQGCPTCLIRCNAVRGSTGSLRPEPHSRGW